MNQQVDYMEIAKTSEQIALIDRALKKMDEGGSFLLGETKDDDSYGYSKTITWSCELDKEMVGVLQKMFQSKKTRLQEKLQRMTAGSSAYADESKTRKE